MAQHVAQHVAEQVAELVAEHVAEHVAGHAERGKPRHASRLVVYTALSAVGGGCARYRWPRSRRPTSSASPTTRRCAATPGR